MDQEGQVVAICLTPRRGDPMRRVEAAEALAGRGLRGDRYCMRCAAGPPQIRSRQLTLIGWEAVEQMMSEVGCGFEVESSRRNIVARDVVLEGLIGRVFRVGDALCWGLEPCPPCRHLAKLTTPRVISVWKESGGIRAEIVKSGGSGLTIRLKC